MDLYEVRKKIGEGKTIFDLPLRVVYYARVSTDKEEQINSLSNQVSYYEEYVSSNKNWKLIRGYVDEGITGTAATKRDDFMQMISDAHDGDFDLVITKEISRFSRNTLDSIRYSQELLSCGVGIFFQNDNINTLMPDSELRLTIMASIAQDEVRKLSERVKFGFKRSIRDGKVLGNENIYGYKKQEGKLIIDEDEAFIVRTIFELYTSGYGIRAVCAELSKRGIHNREGHDFVFSTVKRIIKNPKYKGFYCGNKTHKVAYNLPDIKHLDPSEWVMYEDYDKVPPIVSKEMWEFANLQLEKRSKEILERNASYTNKYIYSGKIFCGEHGCAFHHATYAYKSGSREVWQCKIYKERGKSECDSPTLYTEELDSIVRYIIKFLQLNKSEIIEEELEIIESTFESSRADTDISRLKSKMSDVLKRKDRILDLNINGVISVEEFKKRNEKFNSEIEEIENQLAELESKRLDMLKLKNSTKELRDIISSQFDSLESLTQGLIDSLIDKIIVYKTDDKNVVRLEVYLKLLGEITNFDISRKRGKPSEVFTALGDCKTFVCSRQSI